MPPQITEITKAFMEMITQNNDHLPVFFHKLFELKVVLKQFYHAMEVFGGLFENNDILFCGRLAKAELDEINLPEFDRDIMGGFNYGKAVQAKALRKVHDSLMKSKKLLMVMNFLTDSADLEQQYKNGTAEANSYISSFPGQSLRLFTEQLAGVNLFDFWLTDQKLFHSCMQKLFATAKEVYKVVVIPDLDPVSVEKIICESLQRHQSNPQLQKHRKGLETIIQSTSQLRENFDKYYIGYIKTGSLMTIFELYIKDLTNTSPGTSNGDLKAVMDFFVQESRKITDPVSASKINKIAREAE